MAIVQCERGHFYDNQKYEKCPYCFTGLKRENRLPVWEGGEETVYIRAEQGQAPKEDDRTIGVFETSAGEEPVAGWLVCTGGIEKGKDFRIVAGFNWIGRDYGMEICVGDDRQITRQKHCAVIYDAKKNQFYLAPGIGTVTYLNGELLSKATILSDNDKIKMGTSEYTFVPFCREGRKWEEK